MYCVSARHVLCEYPVLALTLDIFCDVLMRLGSPKLEVRRSSKTVRK